MKNRLIIAFKGIMLWMLMLTSYVSAAPLTFDSTYIRLPDHIAAKAIEKATYLQSLAPDTHVQVTFVLPLRRQKELTALIERISNPADKQYGKYLTTDQFVEQFAPLKEEYDKVIAYAKELGLTIHGTHPNRTLLNVGGLARVVESAFNLKLHQYQLPSGRKFYAADNNPEVPLAIAFVVSGIVGLDNHAKRHTYNRLKEAVHFASVASHSFPSGPSGSYTPSDIVKAYNLTGVSADGTDQAVALFELAGYQASDVDFYTNYFSLPPAKLENVLVDGGSSSGINLEVTLDIELALALAPQSTIYVYEGPNSGQGVLDTYNRIATDNIAKQVSTSWGLGEDRDSSQVLQAESAIFQQMAVQGQSIYSAAGDSGAYDDFPSTALVVDDPSSQPYVTGVGGTKLAVNSQTGDYQSESVWNNGPGAGAGGGGVSGVWPIPSWQAGVSSAYSHTQRNVPDVALNSDPNTGYIVYHGGQWLIVGGTSCAAPLWAAFTACVNQGLAASSQPPVGFANPKLYAIGAGSSYTTDFHDVTLGDNLFYHAQTSYDNATGWGSFNGTNLYSTLTSSTSAPAFNLLMKHFTPFIRGGIGTFHIIVSNIGSNPTSGPVTLSVTLPSAFTYNSSSGPGWTLDKNTLTFTENNVLNSGAKYPTVILNVNVDPHAAYNENPSATVSGGGAASKMVTEFTTARPSKT